MKKCKSDTPSLCPCGRMEILYSIRRMMLCGFCCRQQINEWNTYVEEFNQEHTYGQHDKSLTQ
jgi:hypothetical protein